MRSKSSHVRVLSSGSATPAALKTAGLARMVAALMPAAMPVSPFEPLPAFNAASSILEVSILYLTNPERPTSGVLGDVLFVHLDDIRSVVGSNLSGQLVPVAAPVAILGLDLDVGVLGLKSRDGLLRQLRTLVATPPESEAPPCRRHSFVLLRRHKRSAPKRLQLWQR